MAPMKRPAMIVGPLGKSVHKNSRAAVSAPNSRLGRDRAGALAVKSVKPLAPGALTLITPPPSLLSSESSARTVVVGEAGGAAVPKSSSEAGSADSPSAVLVATEAAKSAPAVGPSGETTPRPADANVIRSHRRAVLPRARPSNDIVTGGPLGLRHSNFEGLDAGLVYLREDDVYLWDRTVLSQVCNAPDFASVCLTPVDEPPSKAGNGDQARANSSLRTRSRSRSISPSRRRLENAVVEPVPDGSTEELSDAISALSSVQMVSGASEFASVFKVAAGKTSALGINAKASRLSKAAPKTSPKGPSTRTANATSKRLLSAAMQASKSSPSLMITRRMAKHAATSVRQKASLGKRPSQPVPIRSVWPRSGPPRKDEKTDAVDWIFHRQVWLNDDLRTMYIEPSRLQVVEAETLEDKKGACMIHMSKRTFAKERGLVEWRVHKGHEGNCQCRTWVLRQPKEPEELDIQAIAAKEAHVRQASWHRERGCPPEVAARGLNCVGAATCGAEYLAAVTVRINYYKSQNARWAQILNMSTADGYERRGCGTMLIAAVEALLRREHVDVVVLYPASNGRAPAFWSSLGYGSCARSFLPSEELITHQHGGPLLPEMDVHANTILPRWEKRLSSGRSHAQCKRPSARAGCERVCSLRFRPSNLRARPASESCLHGSALLEAFRRVRSTQGVLRARLRSRSDEPEKL